MMTVIDTNLQVNASTQYLNFNFDSAAVVFNNTIFLCSEDGLYKMTGSDNDGSKIRAYFEPIETDFGISGPKKLRFIYLKFWSKGDLFIKVKTDEHPNFQEYLVSVVREGLQEARIPISRSLIGTWWTFQIGNSANGPDFSIDEMKVLPMAVSLGRR